MTATPTSSFRDPDDAVAEVLTAVLVDGEPLTVVASPPGAGKSFLVELVSSTAVLAGNQRVVVACQTNAQMLDLAGRASAAYPALPIWVLGRRGFRLPDALTAAGVQLATKPKDLPPDPLVVMATAAKLTWLSPEDDPFDLMVVDEAWQLTAGSFAELARVAEQVLMVGDPGQISPVVSADVRRWRSDRTGPHVAAPDALMARRPDTVRRIDLPVTRRLGPDTAGLVSPTFYPDLPFGSVRPATTSVFAPTPGPAAEPLERAAAGEELILVEVGNETDGTVHDPGVARAVAAVAAAASNGETTRTGTPTTATTVGVACAHVTQVAAVQAILGPTSGVHVDTADRLQGLEFDVVAVWHPLSGRTDPTDFARDAGRMCVMASRHRHACILIGRPGIRSALARAGAGNERVLGVTADPAYRGWEANVGLLDHLHDADRVVRI